MQTPAGGSARPARRCGRPKRFDDTDSEEELSVRSAPRRTAVSSHKRKVAFSDVELESYLNASPVKRHKQMAPKALCFKSTVLQVPSKAESLYSETKKNVGVTQYKSKAGPKSLQEKWGANLDDDSLDLESEDGKSKDIEGEEGDYDEDNAEEEMESMLSEYRQMFGKPVVDMTKGNVMANGTKDTSSEKEETKLPQECRDCMHYKEELDHLEEMIKLKDCELQQILESVNSSRVGGQKLALSLTDNIEKRISYHKLYLEAEKKLRSTAAATDKWEDLYNAEAGKTKDLELRCEALELKLKLEQKKTPPRKPGCVEVPLSKMKELLEIKHYHTKTCVKMSDKIDLLVKENASALKAIQKNEIDYRNKFIRMKKHYHMLLEHYIQKESRYSKRKEVLDKKAALYKDVGSRDQILRDAAKYLNANQMAFLEGQLSTEKTLCGKSNSMPAKYKELLLSIYQNSVITYKILKSYNFNIPPLLSIQQLAQSEVCNPSEEQYSILSERSHPVPADQRTLRALCSDEEDEEINDLLDASSAQQHQDQSLVSDEEAVDGVDGDYGDVQPEEMKEEEEEEGGADYLSDDEPKYQNKLQLSSGAATEEGGESSVSGDVLEQQDFQSDLQQQLDNQLSNRFSSETQFTTELGHQVMTAEQALQEELVPLPAQMEIGEVDSMQCHQIEISDISAGNIVEGSMEIVTVDPGQIMQSDGVAHEGIVAVEATQEHVVGDAGSNADAIHISDVNEPISVEAVRKVIGSIVTTAEKAIHNVVSTPEEVIHSVASTPGVVISSVVSTPDEAIASVISTAGEVADSDVSTAGEAIESVVSSAGEINDSVVSTDGEVIDSAVSTTLEAVLTASTAVVTATQPSPSAGAEVISAETDVAERGPDMPVL